MSKVGSIGIAACLVLFAVGAAQAFHDGGTGACGGCHIMHDGAVVPGPDGALLLAESPSDLCLMCHADDYGAVMGPDPLAPPPEKGAGNFVFLTEDNLNDGPDGMTEPIPGFYAGHNIVAPGRGLLRDPRHTNSPGGLFPSDRLGCTSCHDPHGNAGFRLLHGPGPVQGGLVTFTRAVPAAVGIALDTVEGNSNHTAYQQGMGAWCGNCHGAFHEVRNVPIPRPIHGLGGTHPGDDLMRGGVFPQYNRYNGADDPTGGNQATAYIAAVPFEDLGAATNSTDGPSNNSKVICLSCHRAHASSAPYSGRWDFNVSLLQDDGVVSGSYSIPSPYAAATEGPLCKKCHRTALPTQGPGFRP